MSINTARRRFLRQGYYAGSALLISTNILRPLATQAAAASSDPQVLTTKEWQSVEAMTACIIPTDHQPGAREANCVNFIDKALANEDAAAVPMYKGGLQAVDALTEGLFQRTFSALTSAQQVAFLKNMETNAIDDWPLGEQLPAGVFFENLRMHTIIAFLADPRYGGNQHYSGWQVVGYPGSEHHSGGYTRGQVEGTEEIVPVWVRHGHQL